MTKIIKLNKLELNGFQKQLDIELKKTIMNEIGITDNILSFINSKYYNKALTESTNVSVNPNGMVDDGTGFLFGDMQSYKNFCDKYYAVLGLEVLDYMIDSDEQMNFRMNRPETGMYDATKVTNYPKGNGATYQQNSKLYNDWFNRIKDITKNIGYQLIMFSNDNNKVVESVEEIKKQYIIESEEQEKDKNPGYVLIHKYAKIWYDKIINGEPIDLEDGGQFVMSKSMLDWKGMNTKKHKTLISNNGEEIEYNFKNLLLYSPKSEYKNFFSTAKTKVFYDEDERVKYSIADISNSTFTGVGKFTATAIQYEMGICVLHNENNMKLPHIEAIKKADIKKEKYKKLQFSMFLASVNVANDLSTKFSTTLKYLNNKGKVVGEHFSDGTPKTDIYTNKNINISVKKAKGSQLMSGAKGDTKGIFQAALKSFDKYDSVESNRISEKIQLLIKNSLDEFDNDRIHTEKTVTDIKNKFAKYYTLQRTNELSKKLGSGKKIKKQIEKHIKQELSGGTYNKTTRNINNQINGEKFIDLTVENKYMKKFLKTIKSVDEISYIKNILLKNLSHKKINDILNGVWNSNEFKKWAIFEAMSGVNKFTGTITNDLTTVNNISVANNLLIFNDNGIVKYESITPTLAKEYVDKTRISVTFKGSRSISYSVMRMMVKESEILNIQNIITESINEIKIFNSIENFIKSIYDKILQKLKKIFLKISAKSKEGFLALLNFLDVSIEGDINYDSINYKF